MRYSIVKKDDYLSKTIKKELTLILKGTYDEANPDVVFTIGGDGTVLDAVRKYVHLLEKIKIVAINTGNVGFYTEFLPEDIPLIIQMLDEEKTVISYPLIEINIDNKVNYALNEVVLSMTHHLFEAKVMVDDLDLMDIRADGICISTPSGSTAYNKSLKGAIVDRNIDLIQLVVMAPFETVDKRVVSPLILNKNRTVIIKPLSNYFDISFDRFFITYQHVDAIKIKLSDKKVKFLKNKTQNFPKRLKEKFISSS